MFKEQKYTVIKKAISYELANFAFNYLLLKREAVAWMYQNLHQDLVLGKTSKYPILTLAIVTSSWKR